MENPIVCRPVLRALTVAITLLLATPASINTVGGGESFPFLIPGFDASPTAVDSRSLSDPGRLTEGQVTIRNGHFIDSNGDRLRLLGVNFSFGANFPEHDDAEKVAAHLAKLGINAVRHHHMDARDIWRVDPDGTRELDPVKLEKLAYLITQLAEQRIYSNLNLHVSRSVTEAEGFPDANDLPRYNKYVLYFDARLQALLKDYARALLTYRNPHTGRRLADEPSLVTVEITNENRFSLSGLAPLFALPQRYQDEFQHRWNAFLRERYKTTTKLERAWDTGSEPLGTNLIDARSFGTPGDRWSLSVRGANRAQLHRDTAGPSHGAPAVHLAIERAGGAMHELEFVRGGLTLEEDKLYTLSFMIRSTTPRSVYFDISHDGDPWRPIGFSETIKVTDAWQEIVRPFRATESLRNGARWIFKLGNDNADVYLANPRLCVGGNTLPFDDACTLEAGTIPIPRSSRQQGVTDDLNAFMEETEKAFFVEMIRFLREDLGVRAPITGSQVRWQSLSAFEPLDFVDAHAYWQHPRFPRRSWDPKDWTIPNASMLASPGQDPLSRLAWYRIPDRPYTVSEYNHPAPNDYQIECVPLLCTIAALQDWDGLYLYSYQHGSGDWDSDRIQRFFDINGNPAKLALLPLGARIFRRADVQPARKQLIVQPDESHPQGMALQHRVGAQLTAETATKHLTPSHPRRFVSDTAEVEWDATDPERPTFAIDTPNTKLIMGFVAPGELELSGFQLKLGMTSRNFGLVALTSLDGLALSQSHHMLLTTIANAENRGMEWNQDRTSVSDRWGTTPPLVEMVPATVTLDLDGAATAAPWKAYALTPTGRQKAEVPVHVDSSSLRLEVRSEDSTVWYEIVRD